MKRQMPSTTTIAALKDRGVQTGDLGKVWVPEQRVVIGPVCGKLLGRALGDLQQSWRSRQPRSAIVRRPIDELAGFLRHKLKSKKPTLAQIVKSGWKSSLKKHLVKTRSTSFKTLSQLYGSLLE